MIRWHTCRYSGLASFRLRDSLSTMASSTLFFCVGQNSIRHYSQTCEIVRISQQELNHVSLCRVAVDKKNVYRFSAEKIEVHIARINLTVNCGTRRSKNSSSFVCLSCDHCRCGWTALEVVCSEMDLLLVNSKCNGQRYQLHTVLIRTHYTHHRKSPVLSV